MRPGIAFALLGSVGVLGCGGQILGSGIVTDGGAQGRDVVSSPDAPDDASSSSEASAPTATCQMLSGGGSGGQNSCELQLGEICSTGGPGTTYTADCSCPEGTCMCTSDRGTNLGMTVAAFPGCPTCSAEAAWAACGYPQ